MKNFVGIDLGKRKLTAAKIFDDGRIERLDCTTSPDDLAKLAQWVKEANCVALETGNLAFKIAKQLQKQAGVNVIVLNASELATIYASLKKTDREDALKLARLVQRIPVDELPTVKIPTDLEIRQRALVTEHESFTRTRTMLINRLHALLHNEGLTDVTRSQLKSAQNREKILDQLPDAAKSPAYRLSRAIIAVEYSLTEVHEEQRAHLLVAKPYAQLALSIPGVGDRAAFTLMAFIGDGSRFSNAGQVSYYAGLIPSVYISGDKSHYGRIVKRGCRQIKRVIIQCAWGLINSTHGGPIKEFYERLRTRIGYKKSTVAVARKILETFYAMLRTGELYRDVPQRSLHAKLIRYGLT
jgi:transposase